MLLCVPLFQPFAGGYALLFLCLPASSPGAPHLLAVRHCWAVTDRRGADPAVHRLPVEVRRAARRYSPGREEVPRLEHKEKTTMHSTDNSVKAFHNTMDEWTIKTPNPKCRLFLKIDLLTDFAALCSTDFIDWRYIYTWLLFSIQLVNCCPHGRRNYTSVLLPLSAGGGAALFSGAGGGPAPILRGCLMRGKKLTELGLQHTGWNHNVLYRQQCKKTFRLMSITPKNWFILH